jgi:hypothetical protein
MNGASN